ncbi:MAG: phosphoribosyltransferase [Gammaproteobacteria bacterium]
MTLPFDHRVQAGQLLGQALHKYAQRPDVLVLALPRGGVPVGFEIAKAIGAPLDVMMVRKLGAPGREELAMGAIASGGIRILNPDVVAGLGIPEKIIQTVAAKEQQELERRSHAYRGGRVFPEVKEQCLIVVDDGLATGATMRAAVVALRAKAPARIVVAVPVAPPSSVEQIRQEADEVVCLETPEPFFGVGRWYRDFPQTTDQEVKDLLARSREKSRR